MHAPQASSASFVRIPTTTERLTRQAEHRRQVGLTRTDGMGPVQGRLDLAGNDDLGLSQHPEVCAAAAQAIRDYGASARASRLVTGTTPVHLALAEALCELSGRDWALVFASGYTANLGAITALTAPDTLIISDAHNHASITDGARWAKAPVEIVEQSSIGAVEKALGSRAQPEG